MEGYFLSTRNLKSDKLCGVDKKIITQVLELNKAGLNCHEYNIENFSSKIISKLPFTDISVRWKYDNCFDFANYIYMRRPYVMRNSFILFLKELKKNNPKCKVLLEIPTYPYDIEIKQSSKFGNLLLLYDIINRNRLKGLVDRIVILTDDKTVFNIKTLKIINGVDFDSIAERKYQEADDGSINILAAASFDFWHGYERVINGLNEYYKRNNDIKVVLHMAGNGPELNKYKKLVNKYGLNSFVKFYGYLNSDELYNLYCKCALVLDVFGGYRKKYFDSCSLKISEAMAIGVPIISGCKCSNLSKCNFKYYLEFPNDNSTININMIVEFYNKIYSNSNPDSVTSYIRTIGKSIFDINYSMKEVIEYIYS